MFSRLFTATKSIKKMNFNTLSSFRSFSSKSNGSSGFFNYFIGSAAFTACFGLVAYAESTKNSSSDFVCNDDRCPCKNWKKSDYKTHPCTIKKQFVPGCHELRVFSGGSNIPLATKIAGCLGLNLGDIKLDRFNDGEVSIKLNENVRGKDCWCIQSTNKPVASNIMELLLMVSTLRRSSAKRVSAVIPFYSYRRNMQDCVGLNEDSGFLFSSASEIARMLEVMGVDNVILVDMLSKESIGVVDGSFFSSQTPVESFNSSKLCVEYYSKILDQTKKLVLVAPNTGAISQARNIMDGLQKAHPQWNISVAQTVYNRIENDDADESNHVQNFVSDFEGCNVLIVDNAVSMGNALSAVSKLIKSKGANNIYGFTPNALFSTPECLKTINSSPLIKLLVTDTVEIDDWKREMCPKIEVVSIAEDIAEIIRCEHFVDSKKDE